MRNPDRKKPLSSKHKSLGCMIPVLIMIGFSVADVV